MRFADKLRQLRDAVGLSETALSKASGIPWGTLHHYGQGSRLPSYAAVVKLARALGVDCTAFQDCDDIAGEEEEPVKKPRGKKKGAS